MNSVWTLVDGQGIIISHGSCPENMVPLAPTGYQLLRVAGPQGEARHPEFLAGVLDYLLAHEGLLVEFAESIGADPSSVAPLRRHLPGANPTD